MLYDTLATLERRGGGIILMHDVQDKTAAMLPVLLSELRMRGYRVVHMVPASQNTPMAQGEPPPGWPLPPGLVPDTEAFARALPAPPEPPKYHWQFNNPFEIR
jgi:hypothetical protein